MKNGAAGKKKSRNSHFPKALPWFNHGSTRRGKNAGKKIESALIWGRHLQKGLVKSVGFFFPSRFLCFFFFFLKTSFWKNWFSKPVFLTTLIPCYNYPPFFEKNKLATFFILSAILQLSPTTIIPPPPLVASVVLPQLCSLHCQFFCFGCCKPDTPNRLTSYANSTTLVLGRLYPVCSTIFFVL